MTPDPAARVHTITAPAILTNAALLPFITKAVSVVMGGSVDAVIVRCALLTSIDPSAITTLTTLVARVTSLGATIHLYDVPPRIALQLGDAINLFSSATLSA